MTIQNADQFAAYVDRLGYTRVTDVHEDMHGLSVHIVTEDQREVILRHFTQTFLVDNLTWSVRLSWKDTFNVTICDIPDYKDAELDGIQVGPWNATLTA